MKKSKYSSIVLSFFIASLTYAAEPKLGKYPTVYEGGDYTVTMLRLGKTSKQTVLIKVDGLDNDFDGEIYLHNQKCDNKQCNNFKYETKQVPGKKRWWTIQASSSYGGYSNLSMYPPGIDKKTSIHKVKRPKGFDAKKFYKEYLGQKANR